MRVHVHEWVLNGHWKCLAPDHVHDEPDILDAASIWHTLGVIKTHSFTIDHDEMIHCSCGEESGVAGLGRGLFPYEYMEHLDDAIFYWLRDIDERV